MFIVSPLSVVRALIQLPLFQMLRAPAPVALKSCPVVRGSDGAFGQLSDPLHSFTNRPPSAWIGGLTGDGVQGVEHPHHDGDVACTILPDLVEGFGQQTFEARASGNEAQFSLIQAVGWGKFTGRKPDQDRRQVIDAHHCGRGVVDAGGQRFHGDIDDLPDAERGIGFHRALTADAIGRIQLGRCFIVHAARVDHREQRCALDDKLPDAVFHPQDCLVFAGHIQECSRVDILDVTGLPGRDCRPMLIGKRRPEDAIPVVIISSWANR
jgi:hypothetical protein